MLVHEPTSRFGPALRLPRRSCAESAAFEVSRLNLGSTPIHLGDPVQWINQPMVHLVNRSTGLDQSTPVSHRCTIYMKRIKLPMFPFAASSKTARSRCCLEFVIQPPAAKSNPLSPVQSCCHQDLLRVSEIWSLSSMSRGDKLYRIPAVTGSNLLSPGSQALVPCYCGEPRTVKELPLC
ncbi:hypothetical protein PIB30_062315 [Stylosanthes scabra]|uniref:Uncharacterized protein n=1 Tax=Stylosanthes scabra TaxID=79078 RepID=A0ABU6ZJU8_9FABA|nr:hypothetical protein [Stylosanthes scabra]